MHVTAAQYHMGQVPDETGGPLTEFGQNILDAATAVAQYDLARRCLDINIARAERGEPPIDCATYGTGVQVGIAPETQRMILLAVAALAAVYLLPKLLK